MSLPIESTQIPAPESQVLDSIPSTPSKDPPRMAAKRARDYDDDDDSEDEAPSSSGKRPYPLSFDPNESKFRGRGWKVVCAKHGRNINRCPDSGCRQAIWEFLAQM